MCDSLRVLRGSMKKSVSQIELTLFGYSICQGQPFYRSDSKNVLAFLMSAIC